MIEKLFGTARKALVLTERLDGVARDTREALVMARENRERIIRLETTLDIGMRLVQRRLPDG